MRGVKNTARYGLVGDERWVVRGEQVRHAPKPVVLAPKRSTIEKLAVSATYGKDDDPVAVLRKMRDRIFNEAQATVDRLDDAIRALGGIVE